MPPGGVAVFVECMTDNLKRTIASVRATFSKKGGNLATSGSVDFLFERKGLFILKVGDQDPEELELELIEGGAEDIEYDEDQGEISVTVDFVDFGNMQKKLEDLGIEPQSANLERIPLNTVALDVDGARKVLQLIETLEDDDDVQQVFHNLELTAEMEAQGI